MGATCSTCDADLLCRVSPIEDGANYEWWCPVCEDGHLRAEDSRLRGMAAYALDAPTFDSCKSILRDLLDGVNGAENYDEVKGERETLRASIAALTRERDELKGQVCAIKEAFDKERPACNPATYFSLIVNDVGDALSSSSPCAHEARVKELEKELREYRIQGMAPPRDVHWCDGVSGEEYVLKWDSGDESVGIRGGYVCEELDARMDRIAALEKVVEDIRVAFTRMNPSFPCGEVVMVRRSAYDAISAALSAARVSVHE